MIYLHSYYTKDGKVAHVFYKDEFMYLESCAHENNTVNYYHAISLVDLKVEKIDIFTYQLPGKLNIKYLTKDSINIKVVRDDALNSMFSLSLNSI